MINNRGYVVAICGAGGAGKSLLAAALGNALTANKCRVCVVSFDLTQQGLRVFLPREKNGNGASIGALLSTTTRVSEADVMERVRIHANNDNLGFLACAEGDAFGVWASFLGERVYEVICELARVNDFVVIDINGLPNDSDAINTAYGVAELVIRVLTPDIKGLAWYEATENTIASVYKDNPNTAMLTVINGAKSFTPSDALVDATGADLVLPYSAEVDEAFVGGELIKKYSRRDGVLFERGIKELARRVVSQ